jgi:hypothetical protein
MLTNRDPASRLAYADHMGEADLAQAEDEALLTEMWVSLVS